MIVEEAHKTSVKVGIRTLSPSEWLARVNDNPDEAPHTLIIGPSGAGKTTIAQAIAATRPGYLAILDMKWQPGKWGGLPAIPIDDDGRYTQLEAALKALLAELSARLVSLKQGITEFPELAIIAEEWPTLTKECPSASELFKQVGRLGRELRVRFVGLSQSERVKSLGIVGEGDALDNYTVIRLGKAALDLVPEARTLERPAVLEWKGEQYLLTLAGIVYLSNRTMPPSRSWVMLERTNALQKQGLQHTLQQYSPHEILQGDTRKDTQLRFSVDEIGAIVSLILNNTDTANAVRQMPRYNRSKHKEYVAYYERLRDVLKAQQNTTNNQSAE
jgi:energy-coupling factor transporter ATP-binding protein EcfA2